MSLDKFIANVKSSGLARTNRYSVFFSPPIYLPGQDAEQVLLYCDQVQLPSLNFSTIQNRTFGEFREVPYEKLFGDISMSFYVDTDMKVKSIFDKWMATIQDPTTRTFNYYDDYTCDMIISVQDLNDNTTYRVSMFECYPKTMGAVQLDYASKEVMKLSITMQYKYFETSTVSTLQSEEIITNDRIEEFRKDFTGSQVAFRSYTSIFNPIVV